MAEADVLVESIDKMRVIEFHYKGSWRSAEPHTLGYNKKGILTLCAWQLAGGSGEAWRDFHVDFMSDITLTTESFDEPRDGYNPSDHTMSNIIRAL